MTAIKENAVNDSPATDPSTATEDQSTDNLRPSPAFRKAMEFSGAEVAYEDDEIVLWRAGPTR